MTYASLIDGSLFVVAQSEDKGRYVPRGRKRVAYTRMLTGFISLGIYVFLSGTLTYKVVLSDAWLSKKLFTRSFFFHGHSSQCLIICYRIIELQLMGTVERCKYYAVWLLAEVCFSQLFISTVH